MLEGSTCGAGLPSRLAVLACFLDVRSRLVLLTCGRDLRYRLAASRLELLLAGSGCDLQARV